MSATNPNARRQRTLRRDLRRNIAGREKMLLGLPADKAAELRADIDGMRKALLGDMPALRADVSAPERSGRPGGRARRAARAEAVRAMLEGAGVAVGRAEKGKSC